MRDAIRQQLISKIPEIKGRCFEPHAATMETEKPYIVIEQGADTQDTDWTGFRRIITVWPNISWSKFAKVDQLAEEIIAALHNQLLTTASGDIFTCSFLGPSGSDIVDNDWQIITRGLQFAILALQPIVIPETLPDDAWVHALGAWTQTIFEPDWSIYYTKWPLGYRMPAILWRLSSVNAVSRGMATFEIRKQITGHVVCNLGTTSNMQIEGVFRIIQGLSNDVKIPFDISKRRYLTVSNVTANYQADSFKAGQISMVLSRITNKLAVDDYAGQPGVGKIIIKGGVS